MQLGRRASGPQTFRASLPGARAQGRLARHMDTLPSITFGQCLVSPFAAKIPVTEAAIAVLHQEILQAKSIFVHTSSLTYDGPPI